MKNINLKNLLLIAALSILSPLYVHATHVMGADIAWQSLDNDSFELIVHAYRDCNGIPLGGTGLTYESPGSNCVPNPESANPKVCCGTDITPVCDRSCTRCISNPNCVFPYGIEEFTITAKVYLPPACCYYTIAWQESARNGAITTGAANQDFYLETDLNRCVKPTLSSPYFTDPPVAIFCINQCIIYNPGVEDNSTDSLGRADSLSYSFGYPEASSGTTIGYSTPYTYDAPLIYAGSSKNQAFVFPYCYGFHIDSTNGDIKFKATKVDITVVVLVVQIWRRDSSGIERNVGDIKRDMEIIAMSCPSNRPPVMSGINGDSIYSIHICSGSQSCFNIKASDLDTADSAKIVWNNPGTMSGATFKVTSSKTKSPTAEFCWSPTNKYARSYPYNFVATATDDACPVPGRVSRAFSIYVSAPPIATYSATVQKCGLVNFKASIDSSSPTSIVSYVWTGDSASGSKPLYINGKSGSYNYNQQKKYYYTLTVTGANGCSTNYKDSIGITKIPELQVPKDTGLCSMTQLTVTVIPSDFVKPYAITWNTGDTGTHIHPYISKDTFLVAAIKDATGCTVYDSMNIKILTPPKPALGPDQRACWGHPIMLSTGLPHEPIVKWNWILGTDTLRTYYGDTIMAKDSGIYIVYVKNLSGCSGTDTANIYFNRPIKAPKVDTTVCFGDSVNLFAGYGGSDASYLWIDQLHNRIIDTSLTFKFLATGRTGYGRQANFAIVIKRTNHGITCVDTGYYNVSVNTPSHAVLGSLSPKCISDPPFGLATVPPLVDSSHQGGKLVYPRKPSAIVNNFLYPSVMGATNNDPTLGWIHYIYTNLYKCITEDSIKISINPLPLVSAGHDTALCNTFGKYLLNNKYVIPSGGAWFPMTGTPSNAIVYSKYRDSVFFDRNATGITDAVYGFIYKFTISSGSNTGSCSNSDTVFIKVVPFPTHPVLYSIPPKCVNDPAFQLYTGPPYVDASHENGIWTYPGKPSAVVGNYLYPKVMGETDANSRLGYIHYIYTNNDNCVTDDSIKINITGLPDIYAGKDTEICAMNGKYLLSNTQVHPHDGTWFSLKGTPSNAIVYSTNRDSVFFDPGATGIKDSIYGVEYYYKSTVSPGCSNSDTVFIHAIHLPDAHWTMDYFGDSAYFHAQDSSLAAAMYQWDFGDGKNGTGHSPKHLFQHNKNYSVSLKIGNITGCINSSDSTVYIIKSGIDVLQENNNWIHVYPNPFSSYIMMQYSLNKLSKVSISLFDITGRQITQVKNESQNPGQYKVEINAEKFHLSPGVYLLKFMTDDGIDTRQVVKY